MASWADVRAAAAGLAGARETDMLGEPCFKVGRKGFVHAWRGRVFMKLDRARQELLFEIRPDVFAPMTVGAMRWAYVELDRVDEAAIAELVQEACSRVAPRKLKPAVARA